MGNPVVEAPAPKLSQAWLFLSVVFLLVTVTTVLWGLRRGFDLTDEGFYLLSNAYYREYPSFSGFAVLGGWLMEHFELDVVSLRGLRFTLLIASHAAFSVTVLRWILCRFQLSPESRQFVRWSFCFLLGSVAASYQWAPPSLSYNDWATIFALLAAACVFWLLGNDLLPRKSAALRFVFLGLLIGLSSAGLAFVRWPAAAAIIPLLAFAVIVGGNGGLRISGPLFFGVLVGASAAGAGIHSWLINLRDFLGQFLAVNTFMVSGSHAPVALLAEYSKQFLSGVALPWLQFWWAILLFVVLSAFMLRFPRHQRILDFSACGLIGLTFLYGITAGFFDGAGATDQSVTIQLGLVYMALASLLGRPILEFRWAGPKYPACHLGTLPLSIAYATKVVPTWFRHRKKQIAGLVLLFGLPWVVAFGTDNPLLRPGAQVVIAWKVLVLIPIAALWGSSQMRVFGIGIGLVSLVATQTQFLDGYIFHPYRLATPLYAQSVPVPNLPRGSRLLFDSKTAKSFTALSAQVASLHLGKNPTIMAFYDYPGIVYLLGGYSPALPRYYQSADAQGYTATMLRRRAGLGLPSLSSLHPLILLDRVMDQPMLGVLHEFGIAFPSGYQEIGAYPLPFGNRLIYLCAPLAPDAQLQTSQSSDASRGMSASGARSTELETWSSASKGAASPRKR